MSDNFGNGKKENLEQPLRRYVFQEDPEIKTLSSYINYAEFQRISDEQTFTEKRKSPLINNSKEVIGECEEIEVYDYNTGVTTRSRYETIESEKGIYTVDSEIISNGEKFSVHSTRTINNELSGNKEKAEYRMDENGNETYTYLENGTIGQRIKKTNRGTTIDMFIDGQPDFTYEYDENGKALIPMEEMEQLPDNFVEYIFKMPLPEYTEFTYQLKDDSILQSAVEATKSGTRTSLINKQVQNIKNILFRKRAKEQTKSDKDMSK